MTTKKKGCYVLRYTTAQCESPRIQPGLGCIPSPGLFAKYSQNIPKQAQTLQTFSVCGFCSFLNYMPWYYYLLDSSLPLKQMLSVVITQVEHLSWISSYILFEAMFHFRVCVCEGNHPFSNINLPSIPSKILG